jgi:hypothetical protein
MMKMKFSNEMQLLKMQRTGHLIAKKNEGQKCTSQINFNALPMLPLFCTSVP